MARQGKRYCTTRRRGGILDANTSRDETGDGNPDIHSGRKRADHLSIRPRKEVNKMGCYGTCRMPWDKQVLTIKHLIGGYAWSIGIAHCVKTPLTHVTF